MALPSLHAFSTDNEVQVSINLSTPTAAFVKGKNQIMGITGSMF
jgi:hypothetical protein